ncbi:hypothetical protein OC834_007837, partial [Tilletia horrida]
VPPQRGLRHCRIHSLQGHHRMPSSSSGQPVRNKFRPRAQHRATGPPPVQIVWRTKGGHGRARHQGVPSWRVRSLPHRRLPRKGVL